MVIDKTKALLIHIIRGLQKKLRIIRNVQTPRKLIIKDFIPKGTRQN